MPQLINQPANRISLTNISLVRLKKGKKRYEIACYKNKLLEYRSGLETDLDNVLQVPTIFLNVSKGQTAPSADLQKSFGKGVSNEEIITEILKKGELQVGANERKELLDRVEREVVELVCERVVDPETKRVYTPGMIRKALDLLSKQAGHSQQGISTAASLQDDEDGPAEEEQAGYMGLGKLEIEDDDNDGRPQKNQKKSKKSKNNSNKKNQQDSPAPEASTNTPEPRSDPETAEPLKDSNGKQIPTWTGVSTSKPPKALALEAIKALIYHQPIPVERARMRIRITIPFSIAKTILKSKPTASADDSDAAPSTPSQPAKNMTVKDRVLGFVEQVESQDTNTDGPGGGEWEVTGFVEPGVYKALGEFVAGETRGRGRVEVLDMAVKHED